MQKDSLTEVLKEVSATAERDGSFSFAASSSLTLLLDAGGTLLSIERISRVVLRKTHLSVQTEREERYFVDTDRVVAVRLHAPSVGSGFLPGAD